MSCIWILLLFFGLQNNQRCCCERRIDTSCGCEGRREERREERCEGRREERCVDRRSENDCDCGCGDTFVQTRSFTNFHSQGTCGCEES